MTRQPLDSVVMGLDPGTRYTGVAVSNPEQTMAFALEVIDSTSTDLMARLTSLVEQKKIGQIIVGRPVALRGTPIPMTEHAERFAQQLRQRLTLPVELVDERLSSRQAEQSRGKATRPDAAAAALLLQTYLDRTQRARAKL